MVLNGLLYHNRAEQNQLKTSGERMDTGWILIIFFIIILTDAKVNNYSLKTQFVSECLTTHMRTILFQSYCLWITNKIIVFYRWHNTYWTTFILNTFTTIDIQNTDNMNEHWVPKTPNEWKIREKDMENVRQCNDAK